ncbi:hypothetical protein BJ165DRAFT_1410328 [Panaeolus papilionaceus]|nr:hypothetical protein BJ165DRAFT_1410328 [Panaeolus papilionaceus]
MQFSNIIIFLATSSVALFSANAQILEFCSTVQLTSNNILRAGCSDLRGGTTNSALDLNACIGVSGNSLVSRPNQIRSSFLVEILLPWAAVDVHLDETVRTVPFYSNAIALLELQPEPWIIPLRSTLDSLPAVLMCSRISTVQSNHLFTQNPNAQKVRYQHPTRLVQNLRKSPVKAGGYQSHSHGTVVIKVYGRAWEQL